MQRLFKRGIFSAIAGGLVVSACLAGTFLAAPAARAAEPVAPGSAAPAALASARAAHAAGEYASAQKLLLPLLAAEPSNVEARLVLARALEEHCLAEPAEREYRRVLRTSPREFEALLGLARLRLKERDQESAIEYATLATGERPDDGGALAILARALTRDGEYAEASECARKAVELAPTEAAGHAALATILFRTGDLEGSRRELHETVRCEPGNAYAHHRLGTGSGASFDPASRTAGARAAIATASSLLGESRWEEARTVLDAALRESPDDFKLHHLLAVALTEIDLARHALSRMEEYGGLFDELPSPGERGLAALFPDFESLRPREKKTVALAVAPLRRYLTRLVAAGASHRILPLEMSVCDLPEFRYLADQRTFDRRLYAHVRGLGGRNAVTGREYLWEAADFRYNTLAHEFAHQVHLRAFSPEERERVEELYAEAVLENRCLDYYARSDCSEYFAQGYEAYVSLFKHPCLSATACHTRDELRERDPKLYAFIASVTDLGHETPAFTTAFTERAGRLSLAMGRRSDAASYFATALGASPAGDAGARIAHLLEACRVEAELEGGVVPLRAAPQAGSDGD